MKPLSKHIGLASFCTLAAGMALCGFGLRAAPGGEPQNSASQERTAWVERCLQDFESIKPGITREQVNKKLILDGGLQGASPARYTHPSCRCFKIEIEFEFNRNPADQNRAVTGKHDKVTRVSRPYLERPFAD